MSVGHDLLNVPFPEMVYKLGCAIAESQFKMDMESIEILRIMGDKEEAPVSLPSIKLDGSGELVNDENEDIVTTMLGAGFQPTFYQFAETIIEVKMAITMSHETNYERKYSGEITTTRTSTKWWSKTSSTTVTTTPVDASYSSKYNYTAEGSSLLRTRLVPMPPNSFIQRLLDMKMEAMQMAFELDMKKVELAIEFEKAKISTELQELEDAAEEKMESNG